MLGSRPRAVEVPALVGLTITAAHDAALDRGVLAVPEHRVHSDAVLVTAQYPPAGHRVRRGHRIRIWALPDNPGPNGGGGNGGGGGDGDRAPVGPGPKTPAGTKPAPGG